jgi:hypothetical protein
LMPGWPSAGCRRPCCGCGSCWRPLPSRTRLGGVGAGQGRCVRARRPCAGRLWGRRWRRRPGFSNGARREAASASCASAPQAVPLELLHAYVGPPSGGCCMHVCGQPAAAALRWRAGCMELDAAAPPPPPAVRARCVPAQSGVCYRLSNACFSTPAVMQGDTCRGAAGARVVGWWVRCAARAGGARRTLPRRLRRARHGCGGPAGCPWA